MELIISSPQQRTRHEVAWVELNSPTGNLIIQPGHAPMVLRLKERSPITYGLLSGKQETLEVDHGTVHVTRSTVLLLISSL